MNEVTVNEGGVQRESGLVLVAFIAILLPLVGLAGAAMMAMGGRSNRLMDEVRQEKALLAAEAGIDEANYRATLGTLVNGYPFSRTLAGGSSFTVEPKHLLTDGLNNDGDADTDEADENVFEVKVTGTYGNVHRRIVAYFGPTPGVPDIGSALTVYHQNPQTQLVFNGLGFITGNDTNMDGSPGPNPAIPGITIMPPATLASLTASFSVDDGTRITGAGGTPSLGVSSSSLDLSQLVIDVQAGANIVLSNPSYTSGSWGNGPLGTFNVIYHSGDLTLDGYIQGAGIMVVTGNLQCYGGFRFDGALVVLGNIQMDGSSRGGIEINGAILKGATDYAMQITDNVRISYSSEALGSVPLLSPPSSTLDQFLGWQEVAH